MFFKENKGYIFDLIILCEIKSNSNNYTTYTFYTIETFTIYYNKIKIL